LSYSTILYDTFFCWPEVWIFTIYSNHSVFIPTKLAVPFIVLIQKNSTMGRVKSFITNPFR